MMMTLWIIFAAMILLAIFIILWPLASYRDQALSQTKISQQQENIDIFQERLAELDNEKTQGTLDEPAFLQLKIELEKTLLGDVQVEESTAYKNTGKANAINWLSMAGVAGLFSISSLLTYQSLGASEQYGDYLALADNPIEARPASPQHSKNKAAPDFASAITALKAKLTENPADIENWFLLANSYMAMGHYAEASAVYKKMPELIGVDNPGYASAKAAYAQTLFQISGEKMTPEAETAMQEALKSDPEEPTALILQGLQAYQSNAYTNAIAAWEKAKIKGGKGQIQRFIEPAIANAREKLGQPVQAAVQASDKPKATGNASITIKLDISPEFKEKLSPDARIFIFAKAKMPMPLAAERLQVKDLPITIVLDDTKAAMPTAKLSSAEFVDITARVALSGSARAIKGDLYTTAKHVAVHKGQEISLVINQIVE